MNLVLIVIEFGLKKKKKFYRVLIKFVYLIPLGRLKEIQQMNKPMIGPSPASYKKAFLNPSSGRTYHGFVRLF